MSLVLVVTSSNAQDFQGVATYKTSRAMDIKIDSTQMTSDMHQQMKEMLRKQFQKTFNLSFNKEASVYKEDEKLAPPSIGSGNVQVMVIGDGGGGDGDGGEDAALPLRVLMQDSCQYQCGCQ